jgi:hypothetical protein
MGNVMPDDMARLQRCTSVLQYSTCNAHSEGGDPGDGSGNATLLGIETYSLRSASTYDSYQVWVR